MNKKGLIFMPLFSIAIFIVLTTMFFWFSVNEEKVKEKIGFGDLQLDLYNAYFEGERDSLYYEKYLDYAILKSSSEFKKTGGLNPLCNNRIKFGADCEPDYSNYYLNLLNQNINLDYAELTITNNNVRIKIEKEYKSSGKDYTYTYKKEFSFDKVLDINLEQIEQTKDKIKKCIQNNEITQNCLEYSSIKDNIISYVVNSENNFYDNSPMEFELDLNNHGIVTSIL